MSEDKQQSETPFDPWAMYRERIEWQQKNSEELRGKLVAHQRLPFPTVCKGRTIRKTNLEQAVLELRTLVTAYLAADHRRNFFTDNELEQVKHYRLAFDIILNRLPPRQRLKDADRDYFLSIIDIADYLTWMQTNMRGAELSAA